LLRLIRACAAHEDLEEHSPGGLAARNLQMFYDLKINFEDELDDE